MSRIEAVLFDKDGTLFDFAATWNAWALRVLDDLSEGEQDQRVAIADAIGFDLSAGGFRKDSPVIAGTVREAAICVVGALPGADVEDIEVYLERASAEAAQVEAVPLVPFLAGLVSQDYYIGVMTNDSEYAARANLRAIGVEGMFDFIAGFDSGWGGKPDPAPLLAFARAIGVLPGNVVMVGDSLHDLDAARAAGMRAVGVLTGLAEEADLAPKADVVLPHIGHLPQWIANQS